MPVFCISRPRPKWRAWRQRKAPTSIAPPLNLFVYRIDRLFLLFASNVNAQIAIPEFRKYSSQTYSRALDLGDSSTLHKRQEIEDCNTKFKIFGLWDTLTIPVVFHVQYYGDQPSITTQDIQVQLDQLNLIFYRFDWMNPSYE
jgi:hypothetical protein